MTKNEYIIKEKEKIERKWMKPQTFKAYQNYWIPEEIVKQATKVYSFGVHRDVRFEQRLCLDNKTLEIKCYDPTPDTVKFFQEDFMFKQNMTYYPLAYAEENGYMNFYYDHNAPEKCYSLLPLWEQSDNIKVNTTNLKSIYDEHGPCDIIKADVEGVWKSMCREVIDHKLDFKVFAVEFELALEDHEQALKDMSSLCEEFTDLGYKVHLNRPRNKAISEAIIVK